jgi:hypothetical protein
MVCRITIIKSIISLDFIVDVGYPLIHRMSIGKPGNLTGWVEESFFFRATWCLGNFVVNNFQIFGVNGLQDNYVM